MKTPAALSAEPQDEDDDIQYRFIELDIGTIRYATHGTGPETLLFIHGFGGDLDNWILNIEALGDVATIYALDLPGHGQSVKAMTSDPVEGLARTVVQFIDRLALSPLHLAGHSLGGLVAMLVAKAMPDRLRSLVLVASAGLGAELDDDFIRSFITASEGSKLQPLLERLFADPSHVNPALMVQTLGYKMQQGAPEALAALFDDLVVNGKQRRVMPIDPAGLGFPVLAIAGRADTIIPSTQTFALRKKAKVSTIRDAGHMVIMEKYRTVNTLLREHLATYAVRR